MTSAIGGPFNLWREGGSAHYVGSPFGGRPPALGMKEKHHNPSTFPYPPARGARLLVIADDRAWDWASPPRCHAHHTAILLLCKQERAIALWKHSGPPFSPEGHCIPGYLSRQGETSALVFSVCALRLGIGRERPVRLDPDLKRLRRLEGF